MYEQKRSPFSDLMNLLFRNEKLHHLYHFVRVLFKGNQCENNNKNSQEYPKEHE